MRHGVKQTEQTQGEKNSKISSGPKIKTVLATTVENYRPYLGQKKEKKINK